ncbi:multicomponent Na+:H+ antiporter subunit D [Corynebacterium freneyi]|uniref:Multicomponent Na+:H+ antiporter subunit D n=2 Tax=Corynebacterium freneyi TaxID=134034 RepID=A0ABS4UB06_9CORY|nr:monovalent cation/H+ antiporter subunit D family protein [Corynebacterium freneyi]MBP2333736.1 multicomponent Na+:H+ antiporter subunit D [Corynebacterium freneyi]UBI02545.1 monovalent cation/H+ antiporter subunit D family protein [Corynebacterium freneyi]WJZ04162.1 Na(+)/H(+) antiporter subunit D [Corynebacterium freneyi]
MTGMSAETVSALLPLVAILPLLFAGVAAVLPWAPVRMALSIATPAGMAVVACALLYRVMDSGPIGHNVGGFPGGVSIPFVADAFSLLMLGVASMVVFAGAWFAQVAGENKSRFFASLTLMMLAGMAGAFLTADLFNFFVFMEVMLLPSYGLIAVTGTWHRLAAGRSFVLVNLMTSTVLLIGVALVYGSVGAVNIALLAGSAAGGGPGAVALGLVIIALSVKAGLAPVHTWLPRTYPSTSPAVMAIFSAVHTKVAVYMLFRIYVVIVDMDPSWQWPIIVLMAASMLLGAYAGLAESTMRRVLAYQMVNGMPFILVVLAFTDGDASAVLAAGIFYALHHMVTVGSLVLVSGAIEETYGTGTLSRLSGLARRDQLVAWVFAAMAFSIVGFPPFSGLWGKVGVVVAAASGGDARSAVVITVIVLASLGALLAMVRVWRGVFWGRPMQGIDDSLRVRGALAAPSVFLAAVSVAMFVFVGVVAGWTGAAGDALVDVPAYVEAALGDPASAISYGNLDNVDMGGAATNGVGMIDGVGNDTGVSAAAESAREGATR